MANRFRLRRVQSRSLRAIDALEVASGCDPYCITPIASAETALADSNNIYRNHFCGEYLWREIFLLRQPKKLTRHSQPIPPKLSFCRDAPHVARRSSRSGESIILVPGGWILPRVVVVVVVFAVEVAVVLPWRRRRRRRTAPAATTTVPPPLLLPECWWDAVGDDEGPGRKRATESEIPPRVAVQPRRLREAGRERRLALLRPASSRVSHRRVRRIRFDRVLRQ